MAELTLGLVVLRTNRMETALAFYRTLGLTFVEEKHGSGPIHYSCQLGATVVEIYLGSAQSLYDHQRSGSTLLGFNVPSLDTVLEALQQSGVQPLRAPKQSSWDAARSS